MLHNFEYSCEERQDKASSCHTVRRKTKRQGKELAILYLLSEQKEEGEANSNARKNAGYINFVLWEDVKSSIFITFLLTKLASMTKNYF